MSQEIKYASPATMQENINQTKGRLAKKLSVVNVIPSYATEGMTILYIGTTTQEYQLGGIYKYVSGEWKLISVGDVDLTYYETSFSGTQSEWDALDSDVKALYKIVNITDDFAPEGVEDVVAGYYDSDTGKFYKENTFTTEIAGQVGVVYIELLSHALYVFDANLSSFVISSGGGAANNIAFGYYYENKFYADGMHQTEITPDATKLYVDLVSNSIYRYNTTIASYVAISGGGNYTAGFGISIDNSEISSTDFVGTEADWEALSASEKAKYDFIHITDDTSSVAYKPGHSISDGTTEKTQRDVLVFEGFEVTDDSTNEVTKITDIPYTAGDGIEIDNHEVNVTEDRPSTFVGTTQEWDALTAAEKAQYKVVNLTNDAVGGDMVVVDSVEDGNLNPVTSNAVADVITPIQSSIEASEWKLIETITPNETYFATGSANIYVYENTLIKELIVTCGGAIISKNTINANTAVVVGTLSTNKTLLWSGYGISVRSDTFNGKPNGKIGRVTLGSSTKQIGFAPLETGMAQNECIRGFDFHIGYQ